MDLELGLANLNNLSTGKAWYQDFAIHEASLRENIRDESRYGPSEQSRRDRARIVGQLNELTLKHLGVSFNDLCLNRIPPTGRGNNANLISILFLAADPSDAPRLRLGEEIREIQEKLQLAKLRDRFVLHQRMSTRPEDLSQALLDFVPQIVHFSGHGTTTGAICFEDKVGKTYPIQPDALAALFEQFANQVTCVVLNACYSEAQARAIAKHIDYIIGMNQAIGDNAAIAFAIGFYQALGAGRSVSEAYKLGCVQIGLQGIPENLTPVLIKKS